MVPLTIAMGFAAYRQYRCADYESGCDQYSMRSSVINDSSRRPWGIRTSSGGLGSTTPAARCLISNHFRLRWVTNRAF